MRSWKAVVGGVLIAVGGVWTLQGGGVLNGSFMSGQPLWLWVGLACMVVGAVLLTRGLRSSRR